MYFLSGKRIGLRPLLRKDIGEDYVRWLNDPEVNRYSGRSRYPSNEQSIERYLSSLAKDEHVLAICLKENGRRIGNIKYGPVDWVNRTCEIEILVGEKDEWGKGYASEAIYLVSKHLFLTLDLNRAEAKSANPAFIAAVCSHLGWTREGDMRERFLKDGRFISYSWLSLLRKEFRRIDRFDPGEAENRPGGMGE